MATTNVPQDNMQTTAQAGTTTTFGESSDPNLGARLDYSKPKYQDLWAFILFYAHVAVILAVAIYFWGVVLPEELEDADTSSGSSNSDTTVEDDEDTTGVWIVLLCALAAGSAFGLMWLQLIKLFAEQIIKIMLFVSIAAWGLLALVIIVDGNMGGAVGPIIFCLITCLYTWCVWSRIPFAGACLSVASKIVQTYGGTVWIALLTVFIEFIWIVIWVFAFVAYIISTYNEDTGEFDISQFVVFLMLISLYWGVNVWRNVSHTTTCGVAATWYFSSGKLDNPSTGAFKRTMTTSFGSVCFGSLLVAILQALRAMLKSQGKNGGCAYCLLKCIEGIMRYFNKYAFVQVATYGCSFFTAAKNTWGLFMSKGIMALINDDLTGLALSCGAILGGVVSGLVGYLVAIGFYDEGLSIALAIVGAILGYIVVVIILLVVASGVVAIFVLFAEDPAAMSENRPDEFAKLTGLSPTMQLMATTGNGTDATAAAV